MRLLEERIRKDAVVAPGGVLKVGSFLNQQMDMELLEQLAEELCYRFRDCGVNKVMTIEASGIAMAALVAFRLHVPMVFVKKSKTSNLSGELYTTEVTSFTHGNTYTAVVAKDYIRNTDRLLLVDDFLAHGEALLGMTRLAEMAGAQVAGAGILIEKAFQCGGEKARQAGLRVESLARISFMGDEGQIEFIPDGR